MEGERKSSINKVSGGSAEQKNTVLERLEQAFANQEPLFDSEREKTPEEVDLINAVISEVSNFLREYGAQPLSITSDHIHILDENKFDEEERAIFRPTTAGVFFPDVQAIVSFSSEIKNPLNFAIILAHEIIHFLSFNSRIIKTDGSDQQHRTGLSVRDPKSRENAEVGGREWFTETNEAITEELVKKFFPRLQNIPSLAKEYADVAEVRKGGDDIAYLKVIEVQTRGRTEYQVVDLRTFLYPEYREMHEDLFEQIQKKYPQRFASVEAVFDVFARAGMTGDIKDMASLVESVRRGAFRELARKKTVIEDE